ncbi:MAG: hypothetical protein V3S69_01115 [Dehalococcoidales bacterium]
MADVEGALESSAQSKALSNIADFARGRSERKLARQTAQTRADTANLQLESAQLQLQQAQAGPTASEQDATKLLALQTQKQFAELARGTTFNAFTRYQGDGNTKHLNVLLQDLKNNPAGAKLMPDVVRFDRMEVPNPQDIKALEQFGVLNSGLFYESPEMQDRLVKVTLANGATEVRDLAELYAGSGYTNYMQDADLKRMQTQANIVKALRVRGTGGTGTGEEREAQLLVDEAREAGEELSLIDALQEVRQRKGKFRTKEERQAGRELPTEATEEEFAVRTEEKIAEGRVPTSEREQRIVDTSKAELDKRFGGNFLEADLTNQTQDDRTVIDKALRRIEKVGKLALSNQDKKQLHEISQLLVLGDPTAGITSKETGIIDKAFDNVKKFVSDSTPGVDATSAYAAFRNSVRHALFGSALTAAEIASFQEAFGTLGQQTGPVLQQFKTALSQVQAKLQSIADLNDPFVVKVRFGKSQLELEDTIISIQERIDALNNIEPNVSKTPIVAEVAPTATVDSRGEPAPGDRAPISSFFRN